MRLIYFDEDGYVPPDLISEIGEIDVQTPLCRTEKKLMEEITREQMQKYDTLLHVVGANWERALEWIDRVWRLRTEANYSARPRHLIISAVEFEREIRYKFVKAGAHLICLDEIRGLKRRLQRELDVIQLEIAEVTCSIPHFISVHEGNHGIEHCVPG